MLSAKLARLTPDVTWGTNAYNVETMPELLSGKNIEWNGVYLRGLRQTESCYMSPSLSKQSIRTVFEANIATTATVAGVLLVSPLL